MFIRYTVYCILYSLQMLIYPLATLPNGFRTLYSRRLTCMRPLHLPVVTKRRMWSPRPTW